MKTWVVAILFFSTYCSFCEDTLQTKVRSIEVEASKELQQKVLNIFTKAQFNDSLLARYGLGQVVSSLSFVPGVYIRDYAGIGGVKTISIRGFASPNTLIMLEGIRINSSQNGTFDLNLLPSNLISGYQVFRGGSSFIFGGNSSAGVLNLEIQHPSENFKANFSLASFETYEFSGKAKFNLLSNNSMVCGLSYISSKGNYPFTTNQFGQNVTYIRENGNFENIAALISSSFENENQNYSLLILGSKTRRGVPGAVLQNQIESKRSNLNDIFLLSALQMNYDFSKNVKLTFKISSKFLFEKLYDPEGIGLITKKETAKFNNSQFSFLTILDYNFRKVNFNLSADLVSDKLDGDFLQPEVKGSVHRFSIGIASILYKEFKFFHYESELFASSRFEHSNDYGWQNSYGIGTRILNLMWLFDLASIFSLNFRPPSFNEMYYLNYGTLSLKPERTYSLNLDFSNDKIGIVKPKISLFFYHSFDKIISLPKSPVQWSARNLAKSKSYGIEFSTEINLHKISSLLSYTFQKSIDATHESSTYGKQLPYTPVNIFSFSFKFPLPYEFNASVNHLFIGERYALPDNSYSSKLSAYSLWGFELSKELNFNFSKFIFSFEVSNVFNSSYQIYFNFPMPGRSFRISIKNKF